MGEPITIKFTDAQRIKRLEILLGLFAEELGIEEEKVQELLNHSMLEVLGY